MVEVAQTAVERTFRVALCSGYKVSFLHIEISPRLRVSKVTRAPVLLEHPLDAWLKESRKCAEYIGSRRMNLRCPVCLPTLYMYMKGLPFPVE